LYSKNFTARLLKSKPIKFLKGGVLLKIISFSLNYLLADLLNFNIEFSYFVVLFCDLILGFFINKNLVFDSTTQSREKKVFLKFIIAGVSFRFINWLIYVLILKSLEIYILLAQLIATLIVLLFKYKMYKKIFE
jgi:putative flippase GtrA